MNVTCKEGETINLKCETIENSFPAQWSKDGLVIDIKYGKYSKYQNRNAAQLTIHCANQKDSGCYAVNISDRIRNASVTIKGNTTEE